MFIKSVLYACVVLVVFGGVIQVTTADEEANKAISRRGIEEVWSQGNMSVVDEIIADNYVYHEPAMGEIHGPEGLKQAVLAYRSAYPDLKFTVNDQIAEGDMVVTRWSAEGTHQAELMGIPATGLKTTSVGINISRYEAGKTVEDWSHWDVMGLMQQLGVMTPARPGPKNYLWSKASEVTGEPSDPEANKALIMRFVDEVWNQRNVNVLGEIFITEIIGHNPPIDFIYGPSNIDTLRQSVADYLAAYPSFNVAIDELIAEGDKAVARWTVTATHGGELMGMPPTGNSVSFKGITMYRFADGKVVEMWWAWDTLGMMQQLTAPPEWPIEGAWINTIPIPDLGVIVSQMTVVPQDPAGTLLTSVLRNAKPNPSIFGFFPDADHESEHVGQTVWTASLAYESNWIGYGTKTAESPEQLPEIVYISVLSGRAQFIDRNTLKGGGTHAFYLASQDADGDGLPDEGQEPVACFPYASTSKRVQLMPPCVPPPPELEGE